MSRRSGRSGTRETEKTCSFSRWCESDSKYLTFYAILLAYVVWVFSLPVFPSQDGTVHLYYTEVVNSILRKDGAFGSAFVIKHLFPPYSLHSYLLMLTHPLELAALLLIAGIDAGLRLLQRVWARWIVHSRGVSRLRSAARRRQSGMRQIVRVQSCTKATVSKSSP